MSYFIFSYFPKDFGAASSQLNYAVQTTEGREISEFLSELTDAVEKTKKDKTGNKKDGDRDISTRLVYINYACT